MKPMRSNQQSLQKNLDNEHSKLRVKEFKTNDVSLDKSYRTGDSSNFFKKYQNYSIEPISENEQPKQIKKK